jgi:hypothetical protein
MVEQTLKQSGMKSDQASYGGPGSGSHGSGADMKPSEDIVDYLKCYARERPEVAALWCFGIGFILGWKLKPW